ncbi:response regulator transcription factor [Gluconacetobacter sp. 1b LMG 1731]|uniref:Response regulator transcription factor n=2 Tax=Gluconacetobacter dulcium TaxID=2729096 RepID=A0A7W4NT56_9PROT|nr:response regulator transcription factor [Gluconacetobacter dulcium]MBB2194384.1 response regulator transcription factor [Gluconacetobacter dulcium]
MVGNEKNVRAIAQRPETRAIIGTVIVVDDDAGIRASLDSLFRSADLCVVTFADPSEFLAAGLPDGECCLVLDVRLKTADGLAFQASLAQGGINIPIILMTGHGDIPMTVKGMRAGAIDFLTKPFSDEAILSAVHDALKISRSLRKEVRQRADMQARYEQLSVREREVMALVASGLMNKQVAARLEISLITVKIYRANAMKKMHASSLADLVRQAEELGIRDESVSRYHTEDDTRQR